MAPIVAAIVAIVGVALGVVFGRCSVEPEKSAPNVQVVRPTPNVVVAVRELARLEGAQFHMERVIDLTEKQKTLFGLLESKDAMLLVASGDVVAGVDLSGIGDDDIEVDPGAGRARLRLPRAKILSTRIDNERTYVHSRKTDLLAKRNENLEADARREAERALTESAKEAGITRRAESSVKRTVEGLVRGLGFSDVVVEFED